jgi:hypothetical protein
MGSGTLTGYRTQQVLTAAGVTMRELDWWLRQRVVSSSLAEAEGSGSSRRFSFVDVVVVRFVAFARRRGIELHSPIVTQGIEGLRAAAPADLASGVLVIYDGRGEVVGAFEAADVATECAVNGVSVLIVPLDEIAAGLGTA